MTARHNQTQQAALRRLLKPIIDSGTAVCRRCGNTLPPGVPWDAGHVIDLHKRPDQATMSAEQLVRDGLVRPEHRSCNRSAGAAAGNRKRGQDRKRANRNNRNDFSESNGDSALDLPNPSRKRPRKAVERSTPAGGVDIPAGIVRAPATVLRPKRRGGFVLPRLETPKAPRVRSLGPEVVAWVNESGLNPYPLSGWQEYALHRAFELRGQVLRWRVVIVTISRQQGKSVLARSVAWWRMHQGERFGEQQLLLHTANLAMTATEVWRPAARHADVTYAEVRERMREEMKGTGVRIPLPAKRGKGQEEIDLEPYGHGRWVVQAANDNTGIGYSLSMALVDEAWNVQRRVVDESIFPAMSEREQPQLWLISTAGDSSSDLLRSYREAALADKDGTGDILLLEWSAPPEAPYDDPQTWRWSSPFWSKHREPTLRSQLQSLPEGAFRVQYLNQWVRAVDAWCPPTTWAVGTSDVEPVGPPDVIAVEVSPDGNRYGIVQAWQADDTVIVRGMVTQSASQAWRTVDESPARRLLLPPPLAIHYAGRKRVDVVGVTEAGRHLIGVGRAIAGGKVLHHPEDHALTDDVARAVAVQTESGMRLSVRRSPGPTEAARAMVWAVGELLRPGKAKPRIRSA